MATTVSATAIVLLAICLLLFFLLVIKTVILPLIKILQRDFQECHSGGDGEENLGLADGEENQEEPIEKEEKPNKTKILQKKDLRTRRRRRRRRKVRRKKQTITVKQWQPEKINRLNIKGIYPLFLSTHDRLSHNLIQVIDSTAPHKSPGGGGFSIMQFNLQGLYELFLKSQNWWSKSNCNLPLVRFNGVTLRLYRAEKNDYIVTIQQCYPMCCNDIMYMSTHPAIMLMTKGAIKVPCRQNTKNKNHTKQLESHHLHKC